MYKKGKKISATRIHLGRNNEHTVYEAECAAMTLGVHAIRNRRIKTLTIHVDNQAAIQAAADRKQGPGKYIIDRFHKQIDALRKSNRDIKVTIRWSPGHKGIQGNEEADKAAKEAAAGASSGRKSLPPFLRKALPLSKSALKQDFNKKLKVAAKRAWNESHQAKRLKGVIEAADTKHFKKAIANADRRTGSLWTQLKTGHIGLRKHLKRINISDSDTCPACNQYTETVDHFLRHCRVYQSARDDLRRKVKRDMTDLKKLIGNNKNIEHVVAYAKKTGRFPWLKHHAHNESDTFASSFAGGSGAGQAGGQGSALGANGGRRRRAGGRSGRSGAGRERQEDGVGLLRWFKRVEKRSDGNNPVEVGGAGRATEAAEEGERGGAEGTRRAAEGNLEEEPRQGATATARGTRTRDREKSNERREGRNHAEGLPT